MQSKEHNQHGKERQQKTCVVCGQYPDESQKYKKWLREVNTGATGIWTDIDLIKVLKRRKGEYQPVAITDLTYAKNHEPAYLNAIKNRWFSRDDQGKIFQGIAGAMGVPAYLVAYGQGKVSVLDIMQPEEWVEYTLEEWAERINQL